jgi:hypothetical protein
MISHKRIYSNSSSEISQLDSASTSVLSVLVNFFRFGYSEVLISAIKAFRFPYRYHFTALGEVPHPYFAAIDARYQSTRRFSCLPLHAQVHILFSKC